MASNDSQKLQFYNLQIRLAHLSEPGICTVEDDCVDGGFSGFYTLRHYGRFLRQGVKNEGMVSLLGLFSLTEGLHPHFVLVPGKQIFERHLILKSGKTDGNMKIFQN